MSVGKQFTCYDGNNYENLTSNFSSCLNQDVYTDVIFVCRNNKEVRAHQIVLGCLSKFFYNIFIDNMNTTKEKVLYINVPDIRAKIMKHILNFIYTGKAMLYEEELAEFNEDIKLLGMPLENFTNPSDAAELNEILTPASSEPMKKSRAARIVKDTVDLTDTTLNDTLEQDNGNTNNVNELSSRVEDIPADANIPADVNIPADLPTAVPDIKATLPLIDKNPTDDKPNTTNSDPRIRITSTSSCSSHMTTGKPLKSSDPRNRTTSTSSCTSQETSSNSLKRSIIENRRNSSTSSAGTTVPENRSNTVKSETTVPTLPKNNEKKLPNGDLTTKRIRNAPPPSKRGKYISIDLDVSDDDVITIS